MKRSQRLQLVLDLIRRNEEKEATRLAQLRAQAQAAQKQLADLRQYQEGYHQELRAMSGQAQASRLQVFHSFIGRLGTAIEHQQRACLQAEQRVQQQLLQWQKIHAKRRNMEEFIARCERDEEILDEKKLQRMLDDAQSRRPPGEA